MAVTREVDCYVLGYGNKWQSQGKSIVTFLVMETIDSHKGSRLLRSWLWKQLTVTREVDCYVLGYGNN